MYVYGAGSITAQCSSGPSLLLYATVLVSLLYAHFFMPMLTTLLLRVAFSSGCSCALLVHQRLCAWGLLSPTSGAAGSAIGAAVAAPLPASELQIRALPIEVYKRGR